VLTYPLHHAWAQDGLQVKPLASAIGTAGIGTLISRPRGIVNALSSVIQDYVGAPRVVGTPRLVTADAGRVANMLQSFQAANIPGFESEQSLRQLVDGMVESGQKVRVEAVPLRRETDSEVVARPLAPLGASTVTLLPSGAIVETPTSAAVTAQERQDAIEEQFESKLLALPAGEAAAPGKGVLVGGDAVTDRNDQVPTLRPWSVHADHANNALIVVTPPLGETAAVLDFLRYLDGMVAILDEPVSMVEIVAEIVDVDTNKLEEWGPRFAMATDGKLGGWPAFTRSGFDAAQGQPAGSFNNILDPTAAVGTSGLSKLTAETVAGEGLNVGALLVGSSVRLLATFRALQTEAGAHVEARPAVVTLDNTLAEISAKTSLFIPSVGLNVSSLNQVDIPMSIRVLPQVIEPEPGQLAVSMRIVVEDGNVPPAQGGGAINYSKLATSAIVPSGESVLLAGRRRHQEFDRKRRVPGVSCVPGVGQAFQNSAVSDQSQQRLILISPRIVTRLSQQQRLEQRRKGDDRLAPKGAPPLTDSPPLPHSRECCLRQREAVLMPQAVLRSPQRPPPPRQRQRWLRKPPAPTRRWRYARPPPQRQVSGCSAKAPRLDGCLPLHCPDPPPTFFCLQVSSVSCCHEHMPLSSSTGPAGPGLFLAVLRAGGRAAPPAGRAPGEIRRGDRCPAGGKEGEG